MRILKYFLRWALGCFVMLVVIPAIIVAFMTYRANRIPNNSVLHVVLDGAIAEAPRVTFNEILGGKNNTTLLELTSAIRQAASDSRIVGLLLDIKEPEFGLAQIQELHDALNVFKQSGKWNAAYLETAGEVGSGDGAYALACGATQIFLSPSGEIHLNGMRAEVPFIADMLKRLNITPYTEQRYEYKNFANTFTETGFTPSHKEALKHVLDDLQQTMLSLIATGRNVPVASTKAWILQSPFMGQQAVQNHLVDKLAYWDVVYSDIEKIAEHVDPLIDVARYALASKLKVTPINVALISGIGQISRTETQMGLGGQSGMGADVIAQAFRDARRDGVKAVLFRIDSPGGSYLASDLIRHEVEITKQAGIPVVVSMGNVAASGGYFIATDADYIIAEAGTITGSIGVVAASFPLRQMLQHFFGITFDSYETLPHAGMLSWLDTPSVEDKEKFSATVDTIYKDFVTKVADSRHKSFDDIHRIAKGRIWSGKQAAEIGLVDALGGIETALAYLRNRLNLGAKEQINLIAFPEPENPISMLRRVFSNQGVYGLLQSMLTHMMQQTWYTQQQHATLNMPPLRVQ